MSRNARVWRAILVLVLGIVPGALMGLCARAITQMLAT